MATFTIDDKPAGTVTSATKLIASTSGAVHAPTALQILGLERAFAIVTITVATTITTSTETEITWTTQEQDEGGLWDPSLPKRLTAPVAGLYLLHGGVPWQTHATGIRYARFWKGGAASGTRVGQEDRTAGSSVAGPFLVPSGTVKLAQGDYVTMTVYQSSGAGLDLAAGTERCFFSLTLLNKDP